MDEILGAAVADGKVTPKVQSLIKILLRYQHTDDFRAIIFVERVVAAQILPKVHGKAGHCLYCGHSRILCILLYLFLGRQSTSWSSFLYARCHMVQNL